ncbi:MULTISPECIES: acyl-CoA dehydrogenase family protein [Dactylosporangium]|uniref:Hydroxylase n=2 Tax=Dactylosporangium TaxID=35753 RepID=A0A9W6NN42_9ACTN|nr:MULTISPECIES: acyl-CoA dehydrogenase family protein [Dactylosporangium]UAC01124.1 acyl-CoA dehydrogenase family protein [Dactylosporangium vinaceum]UWZ48689.1 acyl-CoA dehydrogenase family protein [Dactylosporangium matsuzakiense]GLL03059.1 hydroxylase [Dactylosporangium matsuzakiense]
MIVAGLREGGDGETASPPADAAEVLRRAQALAPVLRDRAEDIERNRRLPADVVAALKATGVFRMGFPRELGGLELSSIEQTEVIEALAYGDASAGWCSMIGSDSGLYAAFLESDVVERMFPSLDMVVAGMLFPGGRADRVPGGFRLTGRWQFGSGITHADWVISGAFRYSDGIAEPGPGGIGPGSVLLMVPRAQVEVIDTWHTTGLSGSGSCDYTITDVFVPDEHTLYFSDVRSRPGLLAQPEVHMRNMPGVPLGVARAALDHAREVVVATGRSDDYRSQIVLADCEADFAATRHAVYGALRRQHEVLTAGGTLDDLTALERAALPLSRRHAFRTARSILTRLYDLAQTSAIYRPSPLDRWLRDTTTMCQHVVAQDRILQTAGAHLLGGRPTFPLALGITGPQR